MHQSAYSGTHEVRINGGEDVISREVPSIVETSLQERARVALAENKRYPKRKNDRNYLLRRLIWCEACGNACTGSTSTSRVAGGTKKYSYYGCESGRARWTTVPSHRPPNLSAPWLEDPVWQDLKGFLDDPGESLECVRQQLAGADDTGELEARHADLTKRLAARQAEKDRYVKLYAQDHISEEELETYLLDLKNQIGNLRLLVEATEADLSHKQESALAAKTTEAWLLTLRERAEEVEEDTEEAFEKRRALAKLLVKRIDVGRDEDSGAGRVRVRITYRFGPPTSPDLGTRFGGNGDLLTFAIKSSEESSGARVPRIIDPGYGPVITSGIRVGDELDGEEGRGFYLEDAGFPEHLTWILQVFDTPGALWRWRMTATNLVRSWLGKDPESDLGAEISELLGQTDLSAGLLPMIGMGRDIPDGNMTLRGTKLDIDWRKLKSGPFFARRPSWSR